MNNSKYPLVSIISINFNQVKVTCDFLESLQKITYPNTEIIIVDNASHEDPAPIIYSKYPDVKLIKSYENLGFAGGNNLGIINSKGKYIMLLNNDTEIDKGLLEPLVEIMESNPRIGMVGSKVKYFDNPDTIQYAGSTPMTRFTATSHFIGHNKKDKGQYEKPHPTPFAMGAAMMTSRKVCEQVGLMANFFFLYYEELDWQERIRDAGYLIYYVPASVIYHKESISVGKESALQVYWKTRNRLLLIRRNFSLFEFIVSLIYITFISTIYRVIKYSLKLKWRFIKVHMIALGWHYYNLFNKERIFQNNFLTK